MDFGSVLHVAQKNKDTVKEPVRCYSTKFQPPKKEQRDSKTLSANIQKFLARKDAEEKKKLEEARKRREELLALRSQDKKAVRRMNVMLKRTKSANQSVLDDAIDDDNTAVTLAGPSQPDEDDYGYVSQEASAFYNKMMEKYNKMPEEPKFDLTKKKVSVNLASTKDRVRAALEKEKEEAMMPHKRKRKHKETVEGDGNGSTSQEIVEPEPEEYDEPRPVKKPKPKPAPPALNFAELLKVAEKKQFEPIVIEQKPKDEERPLTKKQKREIDREREWKDRKDGKVPSSSSQPFKIPKTDKNPTKSQADEKRRIPKISGPTASLPAKQPSSLSSRPTPKSSEPTAVTKHHTTSISNQSVRPSHFNNKLISHPKDISKHKNPDSSHSDRKYSSESTSSDRNSSGHRSSGQVSVSSNSAVKNRDPIKPQQRDGYLKDRDAYVKDNQRKLNLSNNAEQKCLPNNRPIPPHAAKYRDLPNGSKPRQAPSTDVKSKPPSNGIKQREQSNDMKPRKLPLGDQKPKQLYSSDTRPKQLPSNDIKSRQYSANDRSKQLPPNGLKPKQFPPNDVRPKQFPPGDLRPKQFPPRSVKPKPGLKNKRRIIDDDDEEYDSEMDDFIDDGPEEDQDYSKYISEIFGYDKSKYKQVDEDDDNMESSFAQQMREEIISTKIGIMEDLEDMRKEEEEKRRKALMKKSKLK